MKKGLIFVFTAYTIWGFFPFLFKFLQNAPAIQIVAHRITWSFVFLLLVGVFRKDIAKIIKSLNKKIIITYSIAGILLSLNWLTYVWGVNSGFIVETSLGYFINPLVSVLFGVIILRERLRGFQWLPIGIATLGVAYLTIVYGSLPWIALVLAATFGTYGLIKKIAPLPSLQGLIIETGTVFIPALVFLFVLESNGSGVFGHISMTTNLLLIFAGLATAIPLIFFATGAPLVPLSTIGIIQYIAPTIQFLIGVLVYHEPFTNSKLIGFSMVWIALIIFTAEGLIHRYRITHRPKSIEAVV